MSSAALRAIPSVERVLLALGQTGVPRVAAVALVRRELAALRLAATARKGGVATASQVPDFDAIVGSARAAVERLRSARIRPVINGTGILVHTNLGRAPLPAATVAALTAAGANYSNLEYDLAAGRRASRASYLEHNLALLCGAPAATVVNNCAAALVLMLRHFTRTKPEVIISRGELIEIGGGFRIPEILEASGARLREIGTTNKTTAADYANAIGSETALMLKVHRSNFYQGGFTASAGIAELAALARQRRIPLAEDLGSGALIQTDKLPGIEHERTPQEALKDGVDLVCFSGDKLMGGPQAGIIAGRTKMVAALKREPFYRALRCDKLILSALEATVDLYLDGAGEIPILEMLRASVTGLRERAEKMADALAGLRVVATVAAGRSEVGGGTLPRSSLESVTLDLAPLGLGSITEFAARLRAGTPAVLGYISADRFRLDLRTVFPRQDKEILLAVRSIVGDK